MIRTICKLWHKESIFSEISKSETMSRSKRIWAVYYGLEQNYNQGINELPAYDSPIKQSWYLFIYGVFKYRESRIAYVQVSEIRGVKNFQRLFGGKWIGFRIDGFGLEIKRAWIVVFCRKSNRFTDFENTVDNRSAVNFGADFGLCLSWCSEFGS